MMIVGVPRSTSAGTIGSVPPERRSSGRTPRARSNASSPSWIACESGRDEAGRRRRKARDLELRARGRRLAQQALDLAGDRLDLLAGREPDRDVRLSEDRQDRLLELRRAALDAVHVERRLGERAQVELLGRLRVGGPRALVCEQLGARRNGLPAAALLVGHGGDSDAERLRQPAVARQHARQRLHERMARVERSAAVDARVQVALARPHAEVEVHEAACRDVERRDTAGDHPRVEDDAGVGAPVVLGQEVDDRVAADLLLAVAGHADVDGQLPHRRELRRRLEQHVELALVVGDTAGIEPAVALSGLEGWAPPGVERRRRLHVEVAVDLDRGRRVGVARGADLADRELAAVHRDELARPARGAHEAADPLRGAVDVVGVRRVGAHARDAQELGELFEPGRVDRGRLRHGGGV